jgi:uridine kinase
MTFVSPFFEYTCHNERLAKTCLIGVAGLSGSGKSEFARRLAAHLDSCSVLTLDSYYHSQSHLPLEARAALNYDHPDALDWPLLAAHLDALGRGDAIEEPHYLFDLHTRSPETRTIRPQPFLILEGILTLCREEVRNRLDLKIFVSTRSEECFRRRLARDMAERGRTEASVREQYESTVWPMAVEFVLPSRDFADLTVDGEDPIHQSVTRVLEFLNRRAVSA